MPLNDETGEAFLNYQTDRNSSGKDGRSIKISLPSNRVLMLSGLVVVALILVILGLRLISGVFSSDPTPQEVIAAFEDEGLEVGDSYPLQDDPSFDDTMMPTVFKDATRFIIPSACPNEECGGRVLSFEDPEDLETTRGYYESLNELELFGSNSGGFLYENDLLLLQIGSDTPKNEADRYAEVFESL